MINKVKTLSRAECQYLMALWIASKGNDLPPVDPDYSLFRENISKMYMDATKSWDISIGRHDYYVDVIFGLKLYSYLNSQDWFNLRAASNTDFWRFLSVSVVPHIVSERWGVDNEDHYWKRPMRIWLRTLWWFIHFSWQNSVEDTQNLLLKPMFSTDTILNVVERSGRNGTNIDLYREILKTYSELNMSIILKFKEKGLKETDLFRAMMKLNTAKIIVTEPNLCTCGVHGYVSTLCEDLGIIIK